MRGLRSPSLAIAILLPAVAAIGYAVFWLVMADRLEGAVARWAEERRAEGWTVAYGPIARGGFPFALDLTLPNPSLARAGDQPLAWRGEALAAAVRPWALGEVTLRFPGRHALVLPVEGRARPMEATVGAGTLDLLFDGRGRAQAAALNLAALDARFGDNGERYRLGKARIVLRRPAIAGSDPTAVAVETDTRIERLTLPPGRAGVMGADVGLVALLANVVGPPPAASTQAAMAAWRDAGGYLEVRDFQMAWGSLQIQGAGTARLDGALQAVVQLDGKVRGGDALVDALVRDRQLGFAEGLLAKGALLALQRPSDDGGPPYLRLAISVRDGNRVYLGPVRIARLPPLQWRP
jgi:hypothetical protein